MSLNFAWLEPLTVAPTAAVSRTVDVQAEGADAEAYYLECPTLAVAATSIIETSYDNVTFRPYKNELNAAIIGPASNTAIKLPAVPAPYWRVRLNAGETLGTSIKLSKLWNAY